MNFMFLFLLAALAGICWLGVAPSSTGGSKNSLQLTTILKYLPKMADNITEGPQLLSYAKRKGLIVNQALEGEEELVMIDREENNNHQWFQGAEMARVQPTEGLLESYVGHYNIRSFMQITDVERLENTGSAQNLSRLKIRMKAMQRSLRAALSAALAGSRGTDLLRPEGLRDVFGGASPATSPSTLQALTATDRPWWAPTLQSITALGPNNAYIQTALTELFLEVKKVMGKPSVGICDQNFYLEYLKSVGGGSPASGFGHARVTQYSGDRPAGKLDLGGPTTIAFQGVEILFDGDVAAPTGDYTGSNLGHVMFCDLDDYEIVFDPRWNFKLYKPRPRSGNDLQWADVYAVVVRMTSRCYNRRRQSMLVLDI